MQNQAIKIARLKKKNNYNTYRKMGSGHNMKIFVSDTIKGIGT